MSEIIDLPYCPHCGTRAFNYGRFKPWHCGACNFRMYSNVASAAAVFIQDDRGRILFTERAHDPGKGKLGMPGGFLDAGESAEAGVLREIGEEVGLEVSDLRYLFSFPNEYHYGGLHYDTIDLFYSARALTTHVMLDPDEVTRVHWKFPGQISKEDLAFSSYYEALKLLEGLVK